MMRRDWMGETIGWQPRPVPELPPREWHALAHAEQERARRKAYALQAEGVEAHGAWRVAMAEARERADLCDALRDAMRDALRDALPARRASRIARTRRALR